MNAIFRTISEAEAAGYERAGERTLETRGVGRILLRDSNGLDEWGYGYTLVACLRATDGSGDMQLVWDGPVVTRSVSLTDEKNRIGQRGAVRTMLAPDLLGPALERARQEIDRTIEVAS